MSRRQQAKRTAFAARTKHHRLLDSIEKQNGHRPGYVGASLGFTLKTGTGSVKLGPGAFFFGGKS